MATAYCKYHPLTLATWHCQRCHIPVCDECTHVGSDAEAVPQCLLCNEALVLLQGQTEVEPFWQRYTDFMRLPFSLQGILCLIVMMLLPMLSPPNLLWPVAGGAFFILMLYGWGVLQQAATGELNSPNVSQLVKSLKSPAFEVALALTIGTLGLSFLASKMALAANGLAVVGALLLPMMLMAVAMERSINAMIQVQVWQAIGAEIRFLYLPLAASSLLLLVLVSAIVHLLADVVSIHIAQGIKNGFYGYYLWVMMAVAGYTLFQFQKQLHFQVSGKKVKKRVVNRRLDSQNTRLEVYLKEGLYERAAALLRTLSDKHKKDVDIQERYYQLLVFMQEREQIPLQASNLLAALHENGQPSQAMQVLAKMQYLMPTFKPESPELCFDLARLCLEQQDYARAANLLRKMHQEYPHYANLPEAYMVLAKVLHEKLNERTEALETMEYLVLRFQKHPRFTLMQNYWRELGGKPKEDFLL